MSVNSTDPIWRHKVSKVICKKCQYEGVQTDFFQEDAIGLICPKCKEQQKLLLIFDNGKQLNLSPVTWYPPRTVITVILAAIIFFGSRDYLPNPHFQILTVFLIVVVAYVMSKDSNRISDRGDKK